jgi:hypothetical protein
MTRAANRIKNLLDAPLNYSRLETRREEFRPVRLNKSAHYIKTLPDDRVQIPSST